MKVKPVLVLRLLSFVLPLASFAAPFEQWFAGMSPKGAQVRVWGRGDEYSVRYEAEDGHAVVFDGELDAYFYARQDQDGALVSAGIAVGDETDADRTTLAAIPLHQADTSAAAREARQRRIAEDDELTGRAAHWAKLKETTRRIREAKEKGLLMAPPKRPTIGTARGLTLLVDFPISASSTKTTWNEKHPKVTDEELERVLNGEDEIPYGNATSVRGYYKDMSNGRLDYQNVVIGPILVPNPRSTYDVVTKSCGTCAKALIGDVLTALKNDANYESRYLPLLRSLDVEAGEVRLLNVWFAGEAAAKWDKGLWAHKSSLDSTTAGKLTFTNDKGETIEFGTYQITPITASPNIYTFCHENGHMLCGFPDLYSYDKDEDGNAIGGNGVGYYSIMNGSRNKTNPIGIDAYLRTAAGWLEPKVLPHGGGTVTVKANGTDVWRYDNPNDPNQYYLIENRQQKGHDESIRGSGILIWRCDEAGSNTHPTELTGFADDVHRWSYELSLEQADGDYDLETDMVYTNGDGDKWDPWYADNGYAPDAFDDDSLPCARWRDASPSGLSLGNFSANGDTMTFTVAKYGDSPPNDDFANAIVISSEGGGEVRSSVGATKEDGEPSHAGKSSATKSIWWRLEIPRTARVTLSTEGSAIDTVMAVYTGSAVDALAKVASNDDAVTGVRYSKVSFDAVGGDVYYVAVAGYSGAAGDVVFRWTEEVVQGLPDLTFPPVDDYPYAAFLSKSDNKVPTFAFEQDDPMYCTFRAKNSGSKDCTDTVTITLSIVNGSGGTVSTKSLTDSDFPVGTTWAWSNKTYFNGLSLPAGQYKLVCEIDSKHVIAEENEANNVCEFAFTVKPGAFPDLKPAAPSKTYPYPVFVGNATNAPAMAEIAYGDPIYYTYRIVNAGTAAISNTTVTMKHSLYDGNGTLVKSDQTTYAKFPVGTTWTWSKSTIFNGLNLHAGKYKIVLVIDSSDVVYEQDESNNVAEFEFTVLPPPPISPGVWTTDAERVRLSAAVDGRMICVAKLKETLPHWSELGPILNDELFLAWAAANGVYLVKWDSLADSSGTSESAKWYNALYTQSGKTAKVNWEMCFARPDAPDTFCGYARAYGTYSIGTVKYDATVAGMIAGFASILSANGLTPIPPEVVPVISLLDWEKGTPEYGAAVEKIQMIATGDNPVVDPQTLYAWIGSRQLGSCDLASSDYIAASALLDTQWPITEGANVAFADVEESLADGFTFRIALKLNGEESPEELTLVKEFVAGCIQTTGVLGAGFSQTVDPDRVMIGADGRVTITPDQQHPAEFFRIAIPRDSQ